jgi:hypothetical protein
LAAVLAIVALIAGGLLWALVDDGGSRPGDEEPASEPSGPPDDPQAETRREFAQAMLRFQEVQSFSYSGSVQATTTRPSAPAPAQWATCTSRAPSSFSLL